VAVLPLAPIPELLPPTDLPGGTAGAADLASGGGDGTTPPSPPGPVPPSWPAPPGAPPAAPAVPEPAGWAMLLAGFGLVGLSLRRRS
jgi:hypothetical protein